MAKYSVHQQPVETLLSWIKSGDIAILKIVKKYHEFKSLVFATRNKERMGLFNFDLSKLNNPTQIT